MNPLLKILFYLALVCCLLTGNMEAKYSNVLVTDRAPKGIFSLQRNWSASLQDSILNSWKKSKVNILIYKPEGISPSVSSGLDIALNNLTVYYLEPEDFLATLPVIQLLNDSSNLKMSTASLLSARFPYLSPTGKLTGLHHFADGGYRENSGTETLSEVLKVFSDELPPDGMPKDTLYSHVRPYIIILSNEIKEEQKLQPANVFEASAPLKGMLNNRSGNALKADTALRLYAIDNRYKYYPVAPRIQQLDSKIYPVLPLGWQISGIRAVCHPRKLLR